MPPFPLFVEGMKRAGWTEIEIPEDLEEMAGTSGSSPAERQGYKNR